jgi:hypothetical protein
MKKVFTLIAAVAMLASVSFAQTAQRSKKAQVAPVAAFKAQLQKKASAMATPKAAGDTVSTFPWTEGFESSTLVGFTFADADGDGLGWTRKTASGDNFNTHEGDGVMTSASWDASTEAALTPDNWMILPAFEIPADADEFTLTWWERGQDASYADEYYSVYVSTTGNAVSNFTTAAYSGYATGAWVKKTVDLSSYAGQTIFIAFRHYNCTDMFVLDIDDIRVGGPLAPEVVISGTAYAILGQPATFIAASSTPTVTWYVDGTQDEETGLTLTYTFTTAGLHEVVVEATNSVASVYDTFNVIVVECNAIEEPFTEDFEAVNPCWQFVSADPANDDNIGIVEEAYSGTGAFAFSSYASAVSEDYNQFLISPELNLSEGTDYMVSFWYKGYNNADSFRVKVSTTTADTAAFTTVLGDYPTVNTDWTLVAFQLPADAKYVAINYYGVYQYFLYVDDFTIDEMGAPFLSLTGDTHIGTGMEAYYTATVSLEDSVRWYVDGNLETGVANNFSYIFTTAGLHEVVAEAVNAYGSAFDTLEVDVFSCDDITIPYAPDFSEGLGCWATRCDETEGSGWFASVDMFESDPEGQILSMSAQSVWGMFMMDFPVDNWIFSPVIAMPESGNYEIAWQVKPFTPDYAGDHYGVYIISGTDTTLLFEETLNSNMLDYEQRAAAIPASLSGDFRVAFRHWDCEGGYVIILDDIQLRNLTAPTVALNGPTQAFTGDHVTYTAISGTATSFAWEVDGVAVNENSNVLTVSFDVAGTHTVSVTATNVTGSNATALTVNVFSCDAITEFPWTADFEDANVYDCWKFIDADGDGYTWDTDFLRDATDESGAPAPAGHNGSNGMVASASYINNLGALTPDNWMILPAMSLPANSNLYLSWYAKGQDASYASEHYSVYVSTTGRDISNFGTAAYTETTNGNWAGHNVDLSAYAGQTVYIAFRHHDCTDMFWLDIDDIQISAQPVGIDEVHSSNISVYPNPASSMVTVSAEGIEGNVTVTIVDVNGREMMQQQGNGTFRFDVSTLAQGAYFVRMTGENVNSVSKLVVE